MNLQKSQLLCKKCSDTGYEHFEHDGKSYIRPCDCLIRHFKARCFGELFEEKTLENYEGRSLSMKQAKEILLKHPDASYFISGNVGLGKTHLLAGLYEKLQRIHYGRVLVLTELQLIDDIRNRSEIVRDGLVEFKTVMVDDMGKVALADWQYEQLFEFYNEIYRRDINLVISTNYDITKIKNLYGGAVTRRIEERCNLIYIKKAD